MRPFVWHPQTNPFWKTKVDRFNRKKQLLKMLTPLAVAVAVAVVVAVAVAVPVAVARAVMVGWQGQWQC